MTPRLTRTAPDRLTILLFSLLAVAIARLWIVPLPSSLWVDELVTTFVLSFPHHYSFAVAPQVPDSLYYWLPGISWNLLGHSETALRLPSILAMGVALFFVFRIAQRVIHPRAGWTAIFLCLALSGIDYFAVDARPYALGIAVASASILFLIRWLDDGRWLDALAFALCAAVLWRVHLLYWPFYPIYPAYAFVRLKQRDVRATPRQILAVAVLVTAALVPVAATAIGRLAGAQAHAFNPPPRFRDILYRTRFNVVLICGAIAWLVSRFAREEQRPSAFSSALSPAAWTLTLGWWLAVPACIAAYSYLTGNGIFIPRYLSLMLPGVALAATAVAACFLPERAWGASAVVAGLVAIALAGQWTVARPRHDQDDWRAAAALERTVAGDRTPVLCPSPFIEAQPPVWTPDYPLPGFLYSHLTYYPIRGRLKLFPFERSENATRYADRILRSDLAPSGRFFLYGSEGGTRYLVGYLKQRPELSHWHFETWHFGNVVLIGVQAPK